MTSAMAHGQSRGSLPLPRDRSDHEPWTLMRSLKGRSNHGGDVDATVAGDPFSPLRVGSAGLWSNHPATEFTDRGGSMGAPWNDGRRFEGSAAGLNAKELSVYIGHSDIRTTYIRYGHLIPGGEVAAAKRLSAFAERNHGERAPGIARRRASAGSVSIERL